MRCDVGSACQAGIRWCLAHVRLQQRDGGRRDRGEEPRCWRSRRFSRRWSDY